MRLRVSATPSVEGTQAKNMRDWECSDAPLELKGQRTGGGATPSADDTVQDTEP